MQRGKQVDNKMHARMKEKTPKRAAEKPSSTLNIAPSHSIESLSNLLQSSNLAASTKRTSRGNRGDDEDFDDAASMASNGSHESNYSQMEDSDFHPVNSAQLALSEILELLSEKRPSNRITGLKNLNNLMTQNYVESLISPQQETLIMYLLNSIKKGDPSEVELACECLSLMALTLGEENEIVMKLTQDLLSETMRNKAKDSKIRAAAINSLAFMNYFYSTHYEDSLKMMELLIEILPPSLSSATSMALSTETVDVALFDSWGLLASTLPETQQIKLLQKHSNVFLAYLKHESVDVRMSVGENIALLFQALQNLTNTEENNNLIENETKDEEIDKKISSSSPRHNLVTTSSFSPLLNELHSLSTDSSRRRARKDRKEQRASFREILSSVELNLEPSFTVTINKIKHEVVGWQNIKQWHALTSILGSSLVSHIIANPTIVSMLDWANIASELIDDGLDDKTRRQNQRQNSKIKAKEDYQLFNKQRAKKMAHVLTQD